MEYLYRRYRTVTTIAEAEPRKGRTRALTLAGIRRSPPAGPVGPVTVKALGAPPARCTLISRDSRVSGTSGPRYGLLLYLQSCHDTCFLLHSVSYGTVLFPSCTGTVSWWQCYLSYY